MKKRGKKLASGGVSLENLEGRMLLSGVVREISGVIFQDLNTNMVQDAGEAPLAGVTIYADANSNSKLDDGEVSSISDANGHYSLTTDVLPELLAVVRPAGWALVANVVSDLTPNVRNFPMGTGPVITGTIFEDADADYFKEGGTTPRSGVTVFLDRNENGLMDGGEESFISDADGKYRFDDVEQGRVQVRAAPVEGWSQEQPVSTLVARPGSEQDSAVFTYRSRTISGTIYKDLNRNGVRDAGEEAFFSVVITATHEKVFGNGSKLVVVPPDPYVTYPKGVSDDTEADGSFVLHDVPIISNQLVISIYDWYLTTSANPDGNQLVIGLAHPSELSSDPQGTVRGTVFNDLNHNGRRDAGEPPVVGVVVQPGVNQWPNTYPTATTDSNGAYEIKLNRGRYQLNVAASQNSAGLEYANNAGSPMFSLFEGETQTFNIPVSYYSWIHWTVAFDSHHGEAAPTGEMWCYLDRNNNGRRDKSEPRIVGHIGDWQTTTTVPGRYTIRIEKFPNHTRLFSAYPNGTAVMGRASENTDHPIVVDAPTFKARGKVFFDKNHNRRMDANEAPLQGVGVLIDRNDNGTFEFGEGPFYTDSAGRFSTFVGYGATRLSVQLPIRYNRLGLFSRDMTIHVFIPDDASPLLIGLTTKKR